jgi:hypothetical protein
MLARKKMEGVEELEDAQVPAEATRVRKRVRVVSPGPSSGSGSAAAAAGFGSAGVATKGGAEGDTPLSVRGSFCFFSGISSLLFLSFSLVPWADCCKESRCQRPVLISLSHSEISQCKCMHVLDCIVVALCSTHACGELAFCWLFGGVAIGAPPPPCLWLRMQLRARFCEVFHCVVCTWSRVPDLGLPRAPLPLCARRRLVDLPPSLRPLPRL